MKESDKRVLVQKLKRYEALVMASCAGSCSLANDFVVHDQRKRLKRCEVKFAILSASEAYFVSRHFFPVLQMKSNYCSSGEVTTSTKVLKDE